MLFRSTVAVWSFFVSVWLINPPALLAHTQLAVPPELKRHEWNQIQQQIEVSRFAAQAHDEFNGALQAVNPAHGFSIDYLPNGNTVLRLNNHSDQHKDESTRTISVRLQGYGYGDELIKMDTVPWLSANAHTVTYQWKPTLREWWINSPRGVEQWFELAEKPNVAKRGQPLVIAMRLDTDLSAQIQDNALHLSSADGSTDLTYDRLKVWDATGRVLSSAMVLNENQLALQVDDTDAVYPITIDPTFAQQAYVKASNADLDDQFSFRVAMDGDTAVVSAVFESSADAASPDDNSVLASGAVYVFVRDAMGQWSEQAVLKASNADAEDFFGFSVGISGDTIVVGAPLEDSNSREINVGQDRNDFANHGAAYIFERDGAGVWTETTYLKPTNANLFSQFGFSVDIDGDTVAVGANLEDSGLDGVFNGDDAIGIGTDFDAFDAGSAYVFVRDGTGVWTQQAYIKAAISDAGDEFGAHVAVDGDTLVVGAGRERSNSRAIINGPGADADNSLNNVGAAYVFVRNSVGDWSQQAYIKSANADDDDRFGFWLDIDGDTLAVGALSDDSNAIGVFAGDGFPAADNNLAINSGAVYMFERDGTTWSQDAYIKASNTGSVDQFGVGLALEGDLLVVGANSDDSAATGPNLDLPDQQDNSATEAGAAFVFQRDGNGTWSQQSYLKPSNTQTFDEFGARLAISGTTIIVSSIGDDSSARGIFHGAAPAEANNNDNAGDDGFSGFTGAAFIFDLAEYNIGGTVTGLVGSGLVLQNNGGDDLNISMDGTFTFITPVADTGSYEVSVLNQPTGPSQTCTVSNETGTVDGLDVTNIEVNCVTDNFTVGGNVSGLNGTGLVLQNNGGDDLIITSNSAFTFTTPLMDFSSYSVTVLSQPTNLSQTCTVSNGLGKLTGADITDVQINCVTDTFTIGGSVNGLIGTSLVLQNNGDDDLLINADGTFTFASALGDGSAYAVTVAVQPNEPSQTCTVTNGAGALAGADVSNVIVNCAIDQFTVGGTVSGLNGTGLVLQNNGGDDLPITVDGAFTFATALDDGSAYAVSVAAQPSALSQTCTVNNASGNLAGADVNDVQVICVTDQFTIGGTVSGLNGTGLVLQNNGGDDLAVPVNESFTFPAALDDGDSYAVTVLTQPSTSRAQQCEVTNGSGTLAGADVDDVVISCIDITLGLSSNDIDLGLVSIGANGVGLATVSNTGTADLTLTDISAPAAPFSLTGGSCLGLPITLAAAESCSIEVNFSPIEAGDFSDQILIISNATSSPDTVVIRGSALFEPLVVPTLNAFGLLMLMLLMLAIGSLMLRPKATG
ncbi:MAG: choice-of-anchor D domain-containing protein [Pseudomonadota bacterium]